MKKSILFSLLLAGLFCQKTSAQKTVAPSQKRPEGLAVKMMLATSHKPHFLLGLDLPVSRMGFFTIRVSRKQVHQDSPYRFANQEYLLEYTVTDVRTQYVGNIFTTNSHHITRTGEPINAKSNFFTAVSWPVSVGYQFHLGSRRLFFFQPQLNLLLNKGVYFERGEPFVVNKQTFPWVGSNETTVTDWRQISTGSGWKLKTYMGASGNAGFHFILKKHFSLDLGFEVGFRGAKYRNLPGVDVGGYASPILQVGYIFPKKQK